MKTIKAMTIIEVLIAIIVAGLVLSAMLTGMNFAGKYARHNANKTMALCYGQGLIEELRGVGYTDLDGYHEYNDTVFLYQGEDVDVEAERDVSIGQVTLDDIVYKTVKVTVSWEWQGKSYTEEVNTMRANY